MKALVTKIHVSIVLKAFEVLTHADKAVLLQSGRCGGRMKIIVFVVQASQIRQILAHVGLRTEAPKTHPARGPPQSDLWLSGLRDSATASKWAVAATYPDAADQDLLLQW